MIVFLRCAEPAPHSRPVIASLGILTKLLGKKQIKSQKT
jgi:hypothetical protein